MNISALLAQDGHLLITTRTKGTLQQLTDLARQSGNHICAVTPGSPLIADLTVAENIALPGMYHLNLSLARIMETLGGAISALGLDAVMDAPPGQPLAARRPEGPTPALRGPGQQHRAAPWPRARRTPSRRSPPWRDWTGPCGCGSPASSGTRRNFRTCP